MKIGYLQSADERVPFSELSIKKMEKDGHQILMEEAFDLEAPLQHLSTSSAKILAEADVLISLMPVEVAWLNQLQDQQHYISFFKPYEPTYEATVLQKCTA